MLQKKIFLIMLLIGALFVFGIGCSSSPGPKITCSLELAEDETPPETSEISKQEIKKTFGNMPEFNLWYDAHLLTATIG